MKKLNELIESIKNYCDLNINSIFSTDILLEKEIEKYGKYRVNRAIAFFKRKKLIVKVMGNIYYIGEKIPSNIDDLIISFYYSLYCENYSENRLTKSNDNEYELLIQYENERQNFNPDDFFKMKKIRKIVDNRDLIRPNKKWFHIVLLSIILILAMVFIWLSVRILPLRPVFRILIGVASSLLFLEFYLRFFFINLIRCYQHYAKEETRRKCICIPSCSDYSIEKLKKCELIYALIKIRRRLFIICRGDNCVVDLP